MSVQLPAFSKMPKPARARVEPESAMHRRVPVGPVVVLLVALALLGVGRLTTPAFVTGTNMLTILRAASLTAIVALGLTFVTISGNFFSLSVAQTAVVGSVLYAALADRGGFALGLAGVLAVCLVLGAMQGAVVGRGGNPIVVTLAAGAAIVGVVLIATHNDRVLLTTPPGSLAVRFGQASPLGVPTQTWAFGVVAIACYLILSRTVLGRRTILLGANRRAAVATGMNAVRVIMFAFAISSVTAGIAGALTSAQFGVADSQQFNGMDIDAIAAVLVGGTSIRGGEGSVLRTCIGAVFIAMLRNLLQIRGYTTGVQLTVEGITVVVAVCAYAFIKRKDH